MTVLKHDHRVRAIGDHTARWYPDCPFREWLCQWKPRHSHLSNQFKKSRKIFRRPEGILKPVPHIRPWKTCESLASPLWQCISLLKTRLRASPNKDCFLLYRVETLQYLKRLFRCLHFKKHWLSPHPENSSVLVIPDFFLIMERPYWYALNASPLADELRRQERWDHQSGNILLFRDLLRILVPHVKSGFSHFLDDDLNPYKKFYKVQYHDFVIS